VLSRGTIHAAGPYHCEHVHIHGEARLTNSPPYGAFRGFGAPQTLFAVERHMDEIARRIGIDPVEMRRRNLLKHGQRTATSQVRRDPLDHAGQMDEALQLIDRENRQRTHDQFNQTHPYLRRGIGIATFYHGAGFTGAGESYLASKVWVEGLPDGKVRVLTAQTDMGQGTTTILAQVAAEALALPQDQVEVTMPDTSLVPNSGPTVASRTAMVVGNLVAKACADLAGQATQRLDRFQKNRSGHASTNEPRAPASGSGHASTNEPRAPASGSGPRPRAAVPEGERRPFKQRTSFETALGDEPTTGEGLQNAIRAWHAAHPNQRLIGRAEYHKPAEIQWDEVDYRGDAYATFGWATYVAEVEVDLRTFGARVTDFVAMQEVGRVLNPTLATGQIAGGVVQGIGWALLEEVVCHDGAMANAQMTNYIIPTAADLPPIRVVFQEEPAPFGPGGAKGIGELPMDGPAPAIANAISRALNISANEIPLTPERLMGLLEGGNA
jgi:CO/xanthine dehydrogenase Mo-binding subunit